MTTKKKSPTGLTCTVDLVALVNACGEAGVKRVRVEEIGFEAIFDGDYSDPQVPIQYNDIDMEQDIVDNEATDGTVKFDPVEAMEVAEDTISDLILSDPEQYEEFIKQGIDEAN